tara:strand:- start:258 stop:905 length:648 start_codon:yes stop_codon:yes gene_type:complete
MNNEIKEHMKKIKKAEPNDEYDGLFTDEINGPNIGSGEKPLELPKKPEFRIKTTSLLQKGLIHLQMGVPKPGDLHEAMEKELGTAFVSTGGDRVLRTYGVAFNIHTSHDSIDEHEMKELGHRLANEFSPIVSFASPTTDYLVMEYVGITEGKDNLGKDVTMLEFHFKGDEKKETLFVAYSHCEPSTKSDEVNYPVLNPEWLLAWLCSHYYDGGGQ